MTKEGSKEEAIRGDLQGDTMYPLWEMRVEYAGGSGLSFSCAERVRFRAKDVCEAVEESLPAVGLRGDIPATAKRVNIIIERVE